MPHVSGIEVKNPRTLEGHNLHLELSFERNFHHWKALERAEDDGVVKERI
jgi:hypothetical protein